MFTQSDTIAAISTAQGEAAISLIRTSGPSTSRILRSIFRGQDPMERERCLCFGRIVEQDGTTVDNAMAVFFRGPRSYTGEDVGEISCHGSTFLARRVLGLVLSAGARLAERGEFTKRAFLNGKMDLIQAEAVLDLITAGSRRGAELSLRMLEGSLSRSVDRAKEDLLNLLACLEAKIDFPEEDREVQGSTSGVRELKRIGSELDSLLGTVDSGRRCKEGIDTVIIGRPNVGKSLLFNVLVGEDRAMVSPIPGTTRDWISGFAEIDGIGFRLSDTAGVRHSEDALEQEGARRAEGVARQSQMAIVVLNGAEDLTAEDEHVESLSRGLPRIVAVNKADLGSRLNREEVCRRFDTNSVVSVSALKSLGIDGLRGAMLKRVEMDKGSLPEGPIVIRERHADCLRRAQQGIRRAVMAWDGGMPLDCVASDIREGLSALGEVVGAVRNEDVLNRIFEEFCIGK